MSIPCCCWTLLLTGFFLLGDTSGQLATTTIDCITPAPFVFESTNEGYAGALERVQIPQDATFTLESPTCPYCLSILSIDHTPGAPYLFVVTKTTLDFEALAEYNGVVTYSIVCMASGVTNIRTLPLKDLNDNEPVFEANSYSSSVSKFLPVGRVVVRVKATDADASPEFNTITYNTEPPSDTFDVTSDGSVVLLKQLSLSNITRYDFHVLARDIGGLSDYTRVLVEVISTDSSNIVQISINKPSGTVEDNLREMEKALERALGYNVTIVQVESSSSGTIVSFIAKETSGNIISPEDVKNDLKENKDKIQSELQEVFGPDTDFDIIYEDKSGINIITIVLGITIPIAMIGGIIAAVIGVRRRRTSEKKRRKSETSMDSMGYPPKF